MTVSKTRQAQEEVLRERILALLDDFQEHAQEVANARRELQESSIDSNAFHGALASLTVWLGGLKTLVPGTLRELEELENLLEQG
jgi:hypothetical protein